MSKQATDLLKDMHQREHGIMTGSGTSALVLAMWALGLRGKRVAIPNGVCYSVPLAVILSGNEPVYLDIERETLSLGLAQLRKYRTWYDAVIAVHNYGARCGIEAIAEYCKEQRIPLIEDCCVALGADDIGHWGDVSVFSFGAGKIMDVGTLGALLCDDPDIVTAAGWMQECFGWRWNVQEFMEWVSSTHTALYNLHYGKDRRRLAVFGKLVELFGSRMLCMPGHDEVTESVYGELKKLWVNLAAREQNWAYLRDRLDGVFIPPKGSVHWRCNIFIDKDRDGLMRHLHSKGYHASSWHAPADLFFERRTMRDNCLRQWIVTDWVADHILNLWVDRTVDDEYIEGVCREVGEWTKS